MLRTINNQLAHFVGRWWMSIATALTLMIIALQLGTPTWWVLLLPVCCLIFVLPGYLIIQTFFAPQPLGLPERVLIMLMSGIAVCVIGGLFLYRTGVGFGAAGWWIIFGTLAICFCVDGLFIRQRQRRAEPIFPRLWDFNFQQIGLLALALLMVIAAYGIMRTPSPPTAYQGYTQLWLHPCAGVEQPKVLVGVNSREFVPTTYRLEVRSAGNTPVASAVLYLQPGEDWQAQLPIKGDVTQTQPLDIFLYRANNPTEIYRHVALRRPNWLAEKMNEAAHSYCQ